MAKNNDGLEIVLGGVSEDEAIISILNKSLPCDADAKELVRQIQTWRSGWNSQTRNSDRDSLYNVVLREWDSNSRIVKTLIDRLSVWFPLGLYNRIPVVLPYVRRVPGCCPDKRIGRPDMRAWPEVGTGICSDDNSQIKELRLLGPVKSVSRGNLGKMSSGYTACHIWQKVFLTGSDALDDERHACNIPILNSFVPNLVWLPKSVAIWTDSENSFAQRYLKLLSYLRFAFNGNHCTGLQQYVDKIWDMLPEPIDMEVDLPNVDQLAEFAIPDRVIIQRITNIGKVIRGLADSLNADTTSYKILRKHYTVQNIRDRVSREKIEELKHWLEAYYDLLKGCASDVVDVGPILPKVTHRERNPRENTIRRLNDELACVGGKTEIELIPNDKSEFQRLLLDKRIARRELIYTDGRHEIGFWRVHALNSQSGIMRNIQSSNFWRSRKDTGLEKVVITVVR